MAGRYSGFNELKAAGGHVGGASPAALAATIGRKRARRLNLSDDNRKVSLGDRQVSARASGKVTEDSPGWNPRTMGNKRGSKNTKFGRMNGQSRPT